jgi:UDP-glucose 4-epimerase
MNIAVIGANGFIGRHLIMQLEREKDHKLFLFGKSAPAGNKHESFRIDLSNSAELSKQFSGIDLVYYLASETIPATSWNDPRVEIEKNLLPFIAFLECVSQLKLKKIVFVSSAGTIYGPTSGKVTESSDKRPFSPYGIIKLTMENFLSYYEVKHGLKHDIFRISNVYGEGQNTGKGLGVINTFLEKIVTEKKVNVFGDGKTTRNYIYVEDVARLLLHSVEAPDTSGIYNLSSDTTLSIRELLQVIRVNVKEDFEVKYDPGRQSDNSFIDLDNTRILECFPGFRFTEFSTGIKRTYDHILSETKTLNGKK